MLIFIIVVFLTLFISANCSLYEAVLYSSRMSTLEAARDNKRTHRLAAKFIRLKQSVSEPIAAILILNTIANTAGATIAGMYAAKVLPADWTALFPILLTIGILFLSEVLPKNIGVVKWRKLWPLIIYPLQITRTLLYPAVYITEKFSRLFTGGSKIYRITEEEILALVRLGAKQGEITHDESAMVKNIINLEEMKARDIMTPRTMIFSLDSYMTIDEAFNDIQGKGFSRIPVYEEHREKIIGYVMAQDIILAKAQGASSALVKSTIREIEFVPGSANCLTLLKKFLKNRQIIAILVDEFGGVAGLITLEDIVETILGTEIVDETDQAVDWQDEARKRKSWDENGQS